VQVETLRVILPLRYSWSAQPPDWAVNIFLVWNCAIFPALLSPMKYKRAPITEAVLEVRYARPIERTAIEKATAAIAPRYFYNEEEQGVNIAVDISGRPPNVKAEWMGRKLSSLDRADVTFLRRSAFVISRLAPYPGWETFRMRMAEAWQAQKRSSGSLEVARIGLRYVNRIDIPVREGEVVDIQNYLNFVPQSPAVFKSPMLGYLVQVQRPLGVDECAFNLVSSAVPSPLINTASFSLDLDVYREVNIPKRDEDIWPLVDRMRVHKNFVFEACVTDRARELFA
jgi:uncharacterized protein (TIGR04255 family)